MFKENESAPLPTPICISYQKIRAGKTRGDGTSCLCQCQSSGKTRQNSSPGSDLFALGHNGRSPHVLWFYSETPIFAITALVSSSVWKLPATKDAFSLGPLPTAAPSLNIAVLLSTRKKSVFFRKSVTPKQTDKPCRNFKMPVKALRKQISFQQT